MTREESMNSASPLERLHVLSSDMVQNTESQSEEIARAAVASTDTALMSGYSQMALAAAGLKPIARLSSDTRMDNIIPHSHATYTISYCSIFVRDFVRGSYNFCAAKMTVARGGKRRGLDQGFKDGEEWVYKTLDWLNERAGRHFPMNFAEIEVRIPHPMAGRLVRMLSEYDRIFEKSMAAMVAHHIDSDIREGILRNAERRVRQLQQLCIPDNDRFDVDGNLLEE